MKSKLILTVLHNLWCLVRAEFNMEIFDMTTDQIARHYKYPIEVHQIKTRDNYLLTIHRLVQTSNKPPALLMHGLMDSSATWLLAGPGKGLGFMLFDEGYDVWMGNFRGNFYSREHTHLSPTSKEFWDFSWDEMGRFDVPAIVDHIIQVTGKKKIFHIGHSMGTTTFYVMTSTFPKYNDKIVAHFSYSPMGFCKHARSVMWRSATYLEGPAGYFYQKRSNGAVLLADSTRLFCCRNWLTMRSCKFLLGLGVGFNSNLNDPTVFKVYINHVGSGSSIKTFMHYTQLLRSGRFREFDYYSSRKNRDRYGVPQPRDYKLSQITAPVFFFYGANDALVSPKDIYKLYRMLPNPKGIEKIEDPRFNHLDFTMAPTATDLLYPRTIKIMQTFL